MASSTDQLWKLLPNGHLVSRPSGKCLDVAGWCSKRNTQQIQIHTCETSGSFFGQTDHYWTYEYQDGTHFRIRNKCTGQCVDVNGWSPARNGVNIHQHPCENWGQRDTGWFGKGGPSDHWWKFVPVTLN